jgi:DNA-directed RNA polymerase subunit RPC12/RpoP
MLSNRICSGCGRQVRLVTTIQSPRCPACRFSLLHPIPETRPCLRCHVPIPADSPNIRCVRCEAARYPEPCFTLCYDCRVLFLVRPGVMRCRSYRLRRSSVVQRPSDFRQTIGVSFNPTSNSFQPISAPMQTPQPKRRRSLPPALALERQPSVLNRAVAFLL